MKLAFDQIDTTILEHFNGGEGCLRAKMFHDGTNKILHGTLAPGCSIGMHTHTTSSEIIYVLSGTGTMCIDGEEELLHSGDCHYCPKGHTHSLMNRSDADVVFFAVVPEQ